MLGEVTTNDVGPKTTESTLVDRITFLLRL